MGLPWVRLDTGIIYHDKMLHLLSDPSPKRYQAAASYMFSLAWSGGTERDGDIPEAALPVIHGNLATARLLEKHDLWVKTPLVGISGTTSCGRSWLWFGLRSGRLSRLVRRRRTVSGITVRTAGVGGTRSLDCVSQLSQSTESVERVARRTEQIDGLTEKDSP